MSDDNNPPPSNRRALLKGAGALGFMALGGSLANLLTDAQKYVQSKVSNIVIESNSSNSTGMDSRRLSLILKGVSDLEAISFPFSGEFGLTVGENHPDTPKDVNGTIIAANPVQKYIRLNNGSPTLIKGTANGDYNRNIITIGSPRSNRSSRDLLGYHGKEGVYYQGKPLVDLDKTSDIRLPIEHVCNGNLIEGSVKYSIGGEARHVRKSALFDRGARTDNILTPRLNASGEITRDYLLISLVPNIRSNQKDSGHRVLEIAGIHSPGTVAFSKLIEDQLLMNELTRQIKSTNSQFWQALISVELSEATKSYEVEGVIKAVPVVI
ncbi:MAG: hypothetical protein ACLGJC_05765 [Alphaproteobacteria bacterium]